MKEEIMNIANSLTMSEFPFIIIFWNLLSNHRQYVEKRIGGQSQACSWALKCCQCCLWCFEKFLKFLSKNAYIEIGEN